MSAIGSLLCGAPSGLCTVRVLGFSTALSVTTVMGVVAIMRGGPSRCSAASIYCVSTGVRYSGVHAM